MTALPIDDSSEQAACAHGRTTVLPAPGTQPALAQRIERTIVLVGLLQVFVNIGLVALLSLLPIVVGTLLLSRPAVAGWFGADAAEPDV